MEAFILEWLNLLGRWAHLVVGIAWIGASFYFVWLDNHLEKPQSSLDDRKGVGGELWSVHGGGFYHAQKYKVAPPALPEKLHWFKWEAYSTFLTGLFLLALIYWYQAEIYLIDRTIMDIGKPLAIALGVASIIGGWLIYDFLCRSDLGKNDNLLAFALLIMLTAVAWALCQVFSGRGAYIHFGAVLGTIMVANVFFVIMPGQRDLVSAMRASRKPDPRYGIAAKQRSVHNTYFTLPVLFVMICNHYSFTYSHEYNWLILIVISLIGALIRVHFVKAHFGNPTPVPAIASLFLFAVLVFALKPMAADNMQTSGVSGQKVGVQIPDVPEDILSNNVSRIVQERCGSCHHSQPSHPGFSVAPQGVQFNSWLDITTQAQAIYQQTVVTRAMPIGNLTGITDEERQQVEQWFKSNF